jgi:hypothetical protein
MPPTLLSGAVVLLNKYMDREVPEGLVKEVGEAAKWLLCGGAPGLEELACRGLMQVRRQGGVFLRLGPWGQASRVAEWNVQLRQMQMRGMQMLQHLMLFCTSPS